MYKKRRVDWLSQSHAPAWRLRWIQHGILDGLHCSGHPEPDGLDSHRKRPIARTVFYAHHGFHNTEGIRSKEQREVRGVVDKQHRSRDGRKRVQRVVEEWI